MNKCFSLLWLVFLFHFPVDAQSPAGSPGVSLQETSTAFELSNPHVTATVSKKSGDLVSLQFKGLELLGSGSGHPFGYWSHAPGKKSITSITINPATNNSERAEVSIKALYDGSPNGSGPGGGTACDVELRYSLGRSDSGIYTYSIFSHATNYPATSIGEARFGMKLNPAIFDYMAIDNNRHGVMPSPEDWQKGTPLNMKEAKRLTTGKFVGKPEHKYDYSAIQFQIPAFGWASSEKHVGLWIINPSIEYLSGGATKVELTGHLDVSDGAAPTLLNYWRGSHYGGSVCEIAAGEEWTRVIGPFMIHCNSGGDGEDLWRAGLERAHTEQLAWPYDWVHGVDFPSASERGKVRGKIVINDVKPLGFTNLLVGLAHPDYKSSGRGASLVDWQQDAKYYEFWVKGNSDGSFEIPKIRPGKFTLHAIVDGVLGELTLPNVIVKGKEISDLKVLQWTPMRHGKQVWDIGIPNRSAEEFFHGDNYWHWGLYLDYPKDFPEDVRYVIGKSNFHKDWNFTQCPRADRPEGTPWQIVFDMQGVPQGEAFLRVALASTSARKIDIAVNGKTAGILSNLTDTATIRRDGIRGYWREREVQFPANLLIKGTNVMTLTIPGGNAMMGVQYDYLRLEISEPK